MCLIGAKLINILRSLPSAMAFFPIDKQSRCQRLRHFTHRDGKRMTACCRRQVGLKVSSHKVLSFARYTLISLIWGNFTFSLIFTILVFLCFFRSFSSCQMPADANPLSEPQTWPVRRGSVVYIHTWAVRGCNPTWGMRIRGIKQCH